MRHPLRFLLRFGRDETDRVSLLGDIEEERRERIARGCGRVSTFLWETAEIIGAWAYSVRDAGRRRLGGAKNSPIVAGHTGSRFLSWADLKLSIRLLFKYPGLTLVASFGIAVGIAISAGFFGFAYSALYPTLPLDEGDRIVALVNSNVATNEEDRRVLHDFFTWREQMTTVVEIGAFRNVDANLQLGSGRAEPVRIAEMTAGAFRLARVPPLHGRFLAPDDERPDAHPVLVIGYDVWRLRFAQNPSVVGQQVRIGNTTHTVVGVMPEGFKFPVSHQYWMPFRVNPVAFERGTGPELFVFGRLAPGATIASAQRELAVVGERTAAAFPKTHARLKPYVVKYTHSITGIAEVGIELAVLTVVLMISLVLVVIALNVAILVYARTAYRQREIAIRTALGASRLRIVMQLFGEALVLALMPAAAGLALAQYGASLALQIEFRGSSPFWLDYSVQPATIGYVVVLVVVTAGIVGVLPALQATRRSIAGDVRQLGGTGLRLGRAWSVLIVAQVAIAVGLLPTVVLSGLTELRHALTRPAYPVEEFVSFEVTTENRKVRLGHRLTELKRRFQDDAEVAGVTFEGSLPGRGGAGRRVEFMRTAAAVVPGDNRATAGAEGVRTFGIDTDYLMVHGRRILAGRLFDARDAGDATNPVIVDRSFVRAFLNGEHAVGRRFRYVPAVGTGEPTAWYEIVGVVENLSTNPLDPDILPPFVFYPVAAEQISAALLRLRVRESSVARLESDLLQRLHHLGTSVDPELQLGEIRPSGVTDNIGALKTRLLGLGLALVMVSVLLLSAAGVYALMSFAVAQRRREIGIRTALGAPPHRVLRSIFSRVAVQIGIGLLVGLAGSIALESPIEFATGWIALSGPRVIVIGAIALMMLLAGFLAAFGPARRGLRIQPVEALRAD